MARLSVKSASKLMS